MTEFFNENLYILKFPIGEKPTKIKFINKSTAIINDKIKLKINKPERKIEVNVSKCGTNYKKSGGIERIIGNQNQLFFIKSINNIQTKSKNRLTKKESKKILDTIKKLQKLENKFKKK